MDMLTAEEGIPLIQPMYYQHEVCEAYDVPNEYYFGTEMIVCPITQPADKRTLLGEFNAWIPEGMYYDFFTKDVYRGGKRLSLYRPLNEIPVLVPAGSIIPLACDYMKSQTSNPEVLEVQIYHGADGSFTMIEDDCSCETGAPLVRTEFTYRLTEDGAALAVQPEGAAAGVIPENRSYKITVFGVSEPASIDVRGASANWEYDDEGRALHIETGVCSDAGFEVEIALTDKAIAVQDKFSNIFNILQRAQIEYELKDRIYDAVTGGRDAAQILASLAEMQTEPSVFGAIAEQLTMDL